MENQIILLTVAIDVVLGIWDVEDITGNQSFSVYPVPVGNDFIYLKTTNTKGASLKVTIIDTGGKVFYQEVKYTGDKWIIDISNLMQGIYIMKLESYGNLQTKRIIKL